MAYQVNGEEIISNDGVVDAKLGPKSVTELTDGTTVELSADDELGIYDAQSGELKRFTIDELSSSGLVGGGGGAVAALDDVGDVDATSPTNNQILTWNNSLSQWEAKDAQAALSGEQFFITGIPYFQGTFYYFTDFDPTITVGNIFMTQLEDNPRKIAISLTDEQGADRTSDYANLQVGNIYDINFSNGRSFTNATFLGVVNDNYLEFSGTYSEFRLPSEAETYTITITSVANQLVGNQQIAGDLTVQGDLTVNSGAITGDGSGLNNIPISAVQNLQTLLDGPGLTITGITYKVDENNAFNSSIPTSIADGTIKFARTDNNVFDPGPKGLLISLVDLDGNDRTNDFGQLTPGNVYTISFSDGNTMEEGTFVGVINDDFLQFNGFYSQLDTTVKNQVLTITTNISVQAGNRRIIGDLEVQGDFDVVGGTIGGDGSRLTNIPTSAVNGLQSFLDFPTTSISLNYPSYTESQAFSSAPSTIDAGFIWYAGKDTSVFNAGIKLVVISVIDQDGNNRSADFDQLLIGSIYTITYGNGRSMDEATYLGETNDNYIMFEGFFPALDGAFDGPTSITIIAGIIQQTGDRRNVGDLEVTGVISGDGSGLTNLPGASVASLDDVGDVDAAAPVDGAMLAYNQTSGNWESTIPTPIVPAYPYIYAGDLADNPNPSTPVVGTGELWYTAVGVVGLNSQLLISGLDINSVNRLNSLVADPTYNPFVSELTGLTVAITLYYDGGFYRFFGVSYDAAFDDPSLSGLIGVLALDGITQGVLPAPGTPISITLDIVDTPGAEPVSGGLRYSYSTSTTNATTATGQFEFNSTTPALIDTFAINKTDDKNINQSAFFESLATGLDYVVYLSYENGTALFEGTYTDNTADTYTFTSGTYTGFLPTSSGEDASITIVPKGSSSASVASLNDVGDVSVAGAADGEVLTRQAGQWVSAAPTGGSGSVASLNDVGDVSVPTPANNQVLTWSGTQWEAQNVQAVLAGGAVNIVNVPYSNIADFTNDSPNATPTGEIGFNSIPFGATEIYLSTTDNLGADRTADFAGLTIGNVYEIVFAGGGSFTGQYNGITSNCFVFINGTNTVGLLRPPFTDSITISETLNVLQGDQRIDGDLEVRGNLDVTNGGVITGNGSGITNVSDTRWKTGISTIGIGMTFIDQINPIKFQYQNPVAGIDTTNTEALPKWDYSEGWAVTDDHWRYGFSAQELAGIEASMGAQHAIVVDDNPERLELRPEGLTPIIVNALKELQTRIESLETENQSLRDRVDVLESN